MCGSKSKDGRRSSCTTGKYSNYTLVGICRDFPSALRTLLLSSIRSVHAGTAIFKESLRGAELNNDTRAAIRHVKPISPGVS